jgi:hypothetical protein
MIFVVKRRRRTIIASRAPCAPMVEARAVYDGPPGQDPAELFAVCEPPPPRHGGFVDEVGPRGV